MFSKLISLASNKAYQMLLRRGARCPDCEKPLDLPRTLPPAGFESTIRCVHCEWMGSIGGLNRASDEDDSSAGRGVTVHPKPSDSQIREVIGLQKATWLIPAKKGFNFLMFFSGFWLSIVVFITFGLITGGVGMEGGGEMSTWGVGLFLIPFWLIGLGVGYMGLRMAYTELLIRVDQKSVVLTRKFFNRMWDTSIPRAQVGKVHLSVAYRQNESPVYQIEIENHEGKGIKFGSNLKKEEKRWVLGGLNHFLNGLDEEESERGNDRVTAVEVESRTFKIEKIGDIGFRVTRIYRAGPWFLGIGALLMVGTLVGILVQCQGYEHDSSSGIEFVFDFVFSAVPLLMTLIGFLIGVGMVAGGYWALGRRKVFEFNEKGLTLTVKCRGERNRKKFSRNEFRQVSHKNSGHVNNESRYKVSLIGDRQALVICDYENEEVADALQAWLVDWLTG